MINIKLDKNSPIPISIQAKEQIKILINAGNYAEGDRLPPINQLASLLGVNKNTIVSILKTLENEGYVESFRGKGVFIRHVKKEKLVDNDFLYRVDLLIADAHARKIDASELINLINARFANTTHANKLKLLFLIGISQELVDVNVHKLKQNIPFAEVDGLYLGKDLTREKAVNAFRWADMLIVPTVIYELIRDRLPKNKPVIKTMANLKQLEKLRRGIDKKSKVAVIGVTQNSAQVLARVFESAKLFRPKLVLSLGNAEKFKKELKDIESVVVCLSARSAFEKLKLKDKNIYFFSDYIDDESISKIKQSMIKA